MGKVTYFIDYIHKTVKAQLSPYLPFKEGWRRGIKDWGEGVGIFFISIIGGNKKGGKRWSF